MIRYVLGILLLIFGLQMAGPVHAQIPLPQTGGDEPAPIAEPSPNDVRELARLLRDPAIVGWLEERAGADNGAISADEAELGILIGEGLKRIRARVGQVGTAIAALPALPDTVSATWKEQIDGQMQLRLIILVTVFLFIGAGLEWLYWCYAGPARRRIEARHNETFWQTGVAALTRLALVASGGLLFGIGAIGAFVVFVWPPIARDLVLELLFVIVALRMIAALAQFALAPRVDTLRLVPLAREDARHLFLGTMLLSLVLFFGGGLADSMRTLSATGPTELGVQIVTAALAALITIVIIWRVLPQHEVRKPSGRRMNRNFPLARILATAAVLAVFVLWLIGASRLAGTIAVLALALPAGRALHATIHDAFEPRPLAGENAAAEDDAPEAVPDEVSDKEKDAEPVADQERDVTIYRPIALRLGRFFVVAVAVLAISKIWGLGFDDLSSAETLPGRVFEIGIDIVVAILIGDLIWVATKTAMDRKMASMPKFVHGHAPGPEARMATLLPIFRIVVMITVIIMVVLIALSSLGINIAPLLAGAGVVGLAIGFGAQALVRDIVSGVFFLIDDAFRVGEYIEMGELRGTVESISIRSLRVRHHRGAVHTIPFGELKSLTNYSRDWVMMKLEFRVPFDTDLSLAKKIVKRIDQELRSNPEYGDSFLEPLKFQGVRRMEEFNMVVGVKFMTRPGEQWTIRRDAYQRIRDEFEKNGIHFAQRNVKVEVIGNQPLTEDVKEAALGAAQDAIEQQAAPNPG